MRLLNTSTLKLEEFFGAIPSYAILSHTWEDGEVLFNDIQNGTGHSKKGYAKVQNCCKLAASENYRYVWIDTCCIDKSSSAELSESLNSMFAYYRDSSVCYVYLDISILTEYLTSGGLQRARWTYRGWTLQELIAPTYVRFYDKDWEFCGTRGDNCDALAEATGIDEKILDPQRSLWGPYHLDQYSIADRMSWASRRQTTRPEDLAYCLFGIFDVNMPPLYGEGAQNAFLRLQEEIIKISTDLSILAWVADETQTHKGWEWPSKTGGLALSPTWFAGSQSIVPLKNEIKHFEMTNKGLQVKLPLIPNEMKNSYTVVLPNCTFAYDGASPIGIRLYSDSWPSWSLPREGVVPVCWRRTSEESDPLRSVYSVNDRDMRTAKVQKIYIVVR